MREGVTLIERRVFKVKGAAVQRSWGRIGVGMMGAQHRASVIGTEFTTHSSSLGHGQEKCRIKAEQ